MSPRTLWSALYWLAESQNVMNYCCDASALERAKFFNLALDVFSITDLQGRLHVTNEAWSKAFGFTMEEIANRPYSDLVHPDDRASTENTLKKLESGQDEVYVECRCLCKSGEYKWFGWTSKVILEEGKLYHVGRDITAQKLLQDLESQRLLLEQRHKFTDMLVHDIKTPLVAADRVLSLLLEDAAGGIPDRVREVLGQLRSSNAETLSLIQNLQEMFRFEQGLTGLAVEEVALDVLINDWLVDHSQEIAAAGIQVETQAAAVPPMKADGFAISRLIGNLLDNALEHAGAGGQVSVTAEFGESGYRLVVQDNGPGILPEALESIFQHYWASGKLRQIGRGLGLFICKLVVDAYGGTISCHSEPGDGAQFIVQLPRSLAL